MPAVGLVAVSERRSITDESLDREDDRSVRSLRVT
jgi:hypothetical protein